MADDKMIAVLVTRTHIDWWHPSELANVLGVSGSPAEIAAWINTHQPDTLRYRQFNARPAQVTLTADVIEHSDVHPERLHAITEKPEGSGDA